MICIVRVTAFLIPYETRELYIESNDDDKLLGSDNMSPLLKTRGRIIAHFNK